MLVGEVHRRYWHACEQQINSHRSYGIYLSVAFGTIIITHIVATYQGQLLIVKGIAFNQVKVFVCLESNMLV